MKQPIARAISPSANDTKTILGGRSRLLGCFETEGELELHCAGEGELRARKVLIGLAGDFAGLVVAEEIEVMGRIEDGFLYADRIILHPGCDVTGELYYGALDISPGSYFEGKSRRHSDPRSLAPAAVE